MEPKIYMNQFSLIYHGSLKSFEMGLKRASLIITFGEKVFFIRFNFGICSILLVT